MGGTRISNYIEWCSIDDNVNKQNANATLAERLPPALKLVKLILWNHIWLICLIEYLVWMVEWNWLNDDLQQKSNCTSAPLRYEEMLQMISN